MNRKDVTADLSEKVAKKLRRQFAIVACRCRRSMR